MALKSADINTRDQEEFDSFAMLLREHGFTVEEIPYAEIAKQEGLLRCSTLPLIRE